MNETLQSELLGELLDLQASKMPYLDDSWSTTSVHRYFDETYFAEEREALLLRQPRIVLHGSEVQERGSFARVELAGRPLLIVRGEDDVVRGFYNVCRHRGAQLVEAQSGCSRRFSCPYHAWTFSNAGQLVGVPHEQSGFPNLEREKMGLHEVACVEYGGWIWVRLEGEDPLDIAGFLGVLNDEVVSLGGESLAVFRSDTWTFDANWKLIVEGGLEAYHFRVAHRETIAPLFLDNLSSYRSFDRHIRSVLPRSHLQSLAEKPREDWSIRADANVIYTLLPTTQFLVQQDHTAWIQLEPLSAGRTRLRLSTVVPRAELVPEKEAYWRKNHDLTVRTLREDFAIGEGIQRGLASGANRNLNFGRYEGALQCFNQALEREIEQWKAAANS